MIHNYISFKLQNYFKLASPVTRGFKTFKGGKSTSPPSRIQLGNFLKSSKYSKKDQKLFKNIHDVLLAQNPENLNDLANLSNKLIEYQKLLVGTVNKMVPTLSYGENKNTDQIKPGLITHHTTPPNPPENLIWQLNTTGSFLDCKQWWQLKSAPDVIIDETRKKTSYQPFQDNFSPPLNRQLISLNYEPSGPNFAERFSCKLKSDAGNIVSFQARKSDETVIINRQGDCLLIGSKKDTFIDTSFGMMYLAENDIAVIPIMTPFKLISENSNSNILMYMAPKGVEIQPMKEIKGLQGPNGGIQERGCIEPNLYPKQNNKKSAILTILDDQTTTIHSANNPLTVYANHGSDRKPFCISPEYFHTTGITAANIASHADPTNGAVIGMFKDGIQTAENCVADLEVFVPRMVNQAAKLPYAHDQGKTTEVFFSRGTYEGRSDLGDTDSLLVSPDYHGPDPLIVDNQRKKYPESSDEPIENDIKKEGSSTLQYLFELRPENGVKITTHSKEYNYFSDTKED